MTPPGPLLARTEAETAYKAGTELLEALVVSESYWLRLWKERGEARLAQIARARQVGLDGPVVRPPSVMADADKVREAVMTLYANGMQAITAIASR